MLLLVQHLHMNRKYLFYIYLFALRFCFPVKVLLLSVGKTCPCSEYPLKSLFYIAKLGYAGVYIFSLILIQNIHFGYSLELPRRGGSNMYPQCFEQNYQNFSNETFNFCFRKNSLYIAWARFRLWSTNFQSCQNRAITSCVLTSTLAQYHNIVTPMGTFRF